VEESSEAVTQRRMQIRQGRQAWLDAQEQEIARKVAVEKQKKAERLEAMYLEEKKAEIRKKEEAEWKDIMKNNPLASGSAIGGTRGARWAPRPAPRSGG
jgi:hypothetical protein